MNGYVTCLSALRKKQEGSVYINRPVVAVRRAAAWVFVILIAQGSAVVGATTAEAISRLQQLAAQDKVQESCLDLALAAGRVVDPDLDANAVKEQIAKMTEEVRKEAAGKDSPEAKIAALNKVIFQTHGFAVPGSAAPIISGKDGLDLYLLHRFLKTRKAHCEGMATLYLIVGEAAGLPVTICNAPIHSYCRFETGGSHLNIECTDRGSLRSDADRQRMNGAKPAAVGSKTYFCPLSKKQFLCLQINALAYGLAKQDKGPAPLDKKQMVQLAELIANLDPGRPESLDTAALIYSQAGDFRRAAELEKSTLDSAQRYGTTAEILSYFRQTLERYQQTENRGK